MIIIILIAFLLNKPFTSELLKNTSEVSTVAQQKCLQILPEMKKNQNTLSALVCGKQLEEPNLKNNLNKSSLIHIFIVSGSHLILLDELLSILRIPLYLRILILGFYTLAVGLQPPAARAFAAIGLRSGFRFFKLNYPSDLITLIAGIGVLTVFPAWWISSSLMMSWCASLALSIHFSHYKENIPLRIFIVQLLIFVLMIVPLWGLGNLHPAGILNNIILAPLITFGLLPMAILSIVFHPLLPCFEWLTNNLNLLLAAVNEVILPPHARQLGPAKIWVWIFFWHILIMIYRIHMHRGKDCGR